MRFLLWKLPPSSTCRRLRLLLACNAMTALGNQHCTSECNVQHKGQKAKQMSHLPFFSRTSAITHHTLVRHVFDTNQCLAGEGMFVCMGSGTLFPHLFGKKQRKKPRESQTTPALPEQTQHHQCTRVSGSSSTCDATCSA